MSNVLLEAVGEVHEQKLANEKKIEEQREEKFLKTQEQLQAVFLPEVFESFDLKGFKRSGEDVKFTGYLYIDEIPVKLSIAFNGKDLYNLMFIYIGSEQIRSNSLQIPHLNYMDQPESLNKVQKENSNKLAFNLERIIHETIPDLKITRTRYYKEEIPRNSAGAYKVPKLLENLELDKVFLSEELYENTKKTLLGVLEMKQKEDVKQAEEDKLGYQIVQEELERYGKETFAYDAAMTSLAKKLGEQYFKPWRMDTYTYMATMVDFSMLRDEDGETDKDLAEALSWTCNCISEPDSEGFRKTVDIYGNVRDRKIMGTIIHVDRTEFNEYPDPRNWNFWKRISLTKNYGSSYTFYVNPLTEVADFGYLLPKEPISWVDGAKARGVEHPYKYQVRK